MIKGITKGDSITFEGDLNENISNWKIRAEIWDDSGNEIKLATSNSSGADTQIKITDSSNGLFEIYVKKGDTEDFDDEATLEVEVETTNTVGGEAEVITVKREKIKFEDEEVDWTDPSA